MKSKNKNIRTSPHKDFYPCEIVITQEPEVVYVRKGYHLEPCHGEAHTNPYIDHCMSCLNLFWGWKVVEDEVIP